MESTNFWVWSHSFIYFTTFFLAKTNGDILWIASTEYYECDWNSSWLYLQWNLFNSQIAFEFGLYAYVRPQWGTKNSKRTSAFGPFLQSYSRFTGILAYGMVYNKKSNVMFPSQDIIVSKKQKILASFVGYEWFLRLYYLGKEILFWADIFRTFYSQIDKFVRKISDRNTLIRFLGMYHSIG